MSVYDKGKIIWAIVLPMALLVMLVDIRGKAGITKGTDLSEYF
jgi:hypothetical protein